MSDVALGRLRRLSDHLGQWYSWDDGWVSLDEWREIYERVNLARTA